MLGCPLEGFTFPKERLLFDGVKATIIKTIYTIVVSAIDVCKILDTKGVRAAGCGVSISGGTKGVGRLGIILVTSLRLKCGVKYGRVRRVARGVGRRGPSLIMITKSVFSGRCRTLSSPRGLTRVLEKVQSGCNICTYCKGRSVRRGVLTNFAFNDGRGGRDAPRVSRFLRGTKVALLESRCILVSSSFCLCKEPSCRHPKQKVSGQGAPRRVARNVSISLPILIVSRRPERLRRLTSANISMSLYKRARSKRMFPKGVIVEFF